MSPAHTFADKFLFIVLTIVTLLTFVDWLIGPSGRERIRTIVGDWWVFVEETSFGEKISLEGRRFLVLYSSFFGSPQSGLSDIDYYDWWMRRLIFLVFPGLWGMLIAALTWWYHYGLGQPLLPGEEGGSPQVLIAPIILSTAIGFVGIWILGRTLLVVSARGGLLSLMLSFGALLLYAVAIALIAIISAVSANLFEFYVRPLYVANLVQQSFLREFSFSYLGVTRSFQTNDFITLLTLTFSVFSNALVLLLFLLINSGFIIAKTFRVILGPISSLLLQRFYSSDKGVLTLLALGGGAVAKLIQELTKLI